jgi:hypothetical protein
MAHRKNWLLLAIARAADGQLSPTQTQQAMFILSEEGGALIARPFYSFRPYNYGPFDATIYQDVDDLQRGGLLRIVHTERSASYQITPAGLNHADQLRESLDGRATDYLGRVVVWVKSLSFDAVLEAIYAKYPEYKKNAGSIAVTESPPRAAGRKDAVRR